MAEKNSIKLVITFAERGRGKTLAKLYGKQGVFCSCQCMGRGTASSELLDVLGVGTSEKDILICLAEQENVKRLLNRMDNEAEGAYGSGILFDLPVTGLNSLVAAVLLNGRNKESGGMGMEGKTEHSLILILVNQGHTDAVMDTAREAGAGGGTVVRARWAGPEDTSQFYGISVQSEKEIIAIVAADDRRNAIMEMVNKKHGLKTEAGAVICSAGIDRLVRFS